LLDKPYAFFGHSMGALIAFELARSIRCGEFNQPEHIFISGRRAPHLPSKRKPLHNLPDEELIREMERLNGTSDEILRNQELMRLLLPVLRADFELVESYRYTARAPLRCPLSVYGGLQDREIMRHELQGWARETDGPFRLRMFPGDHFFLNSSQNVLLDSLCQELRPYESRFRLAESRSVR